MDRFENSEFDHNVHERHLKDCNKIDHVGLENGNKESEPTEEAKLSELKRLI